MPRRLGRCDRALVAFVLLGAACFLAIQVLVFPSLLPAMDSTLLRGPMDHADPDDAHGEARLLRAFLPADQRQANNNDKTNTTVPAWVQSTPQFQEFIARVDRKTQQFDCGDGILVPLAAVNDGFCDCQSAVDEPGTAACSGQAPSAMGPAPSFLCRVKEKEQSGGSSKKRVRVGSVMPSLRGVASASGGVEDGGDMPPEYVWLPASKVGDRIVDCACGEDEGPPLCHE